MLNHSVLERGLSWALKQLQRRVPYSSDNPFIEGAYAPIEDEVEQASPKLIGKIPAELNGMYARIGPNPASVRNPAAHHWFLGDGMVHGVKLGEGRAHWYRRRYVASDTMQKRLGRPPVPGDRRGLFDVVNTNLLTHGGRTWALVEAGSVPAELDSDLNTLRHGLFNGPSRSGFSAHPHPDPATGELHAICYDAKNLGRVKHVVIDKDCNVTRTVDVPVKHGPMIHDCAISARYVLVFDLSITFSFREMLRGYPLPYRWNEKHRSRVGLLPRDGDAGQIRWCSLDEPCFLFHPVNAFELDDGKVVTDVVVHPKLFHVSHQGPEFESSVLERWTLNPQTGSVDRRCLSRVNQEFPRIDERLTTRPHRFVYAPGVSVPASPQPLYKHDVINGRSEQRGFGNAAPGEFVFVPRRPDSAEDEGWLLGFVHDVNNGPSQFQILDAQDFQADPVAVVELGHRVPFGFHGNWCPSA